MDEILAVIAGLATGGATSALGAAAGLFARWFQQRQIDRHSIQLKEIEHKQEMERLDRQLDLDKARSGLAMAAGQQQYEIERLLLDAKAVATDASSEWDAIRDSVSGSMRSTGNAIVDIANALQRPIIVYGLFMPYLLALFLSWSVQVYRGTDAMAAFTQVYAGFPEILLSSIAGWLFADRTIRRYRRGGAE